MADGIMIPLWVLFLILGVTSLFGIIFTWLWGFIQRKRAAGEWGGGMPVLDCRGAPQAPAVIFQVEDTDGMFEHSTNYGADDVLITEVTGWLGRRTYPVKKRDILQVAPNFAIFGREAIERVLGKQTEDLHARIASLEVDVQYWQDRYGVAVNNPVRIIEENADAAKKSAESVQMLVPRVDNKPGQRGKRNG